MQSWADSWSSLHRAKVQHKFLRPLVVDFTRVQSSSLAKSWPKSLKYTNEQEQSAGLLAHSCSSRRRNQLVFSCSFPARRSHSCLFRGNQLGARLPESESKRDFDAVEGHHLKVMHAAHEKTSSQTTAVKTRVRAKGGVCISSFQAQKVAELLGRDQAAYYSTTRWPHIGYICYDLHFCSQNQQTFTFLILSLENEF